MAGAGRGERVVGVLLAVAALAAVTTAAWSALRADGRSRPWVVAAKERVSAEGRRGRLARPAAIGPLHAGGRSPIERSAPDVAPPRLPEDRPLAPATIARWIADLADDDVRRNALRASWRLSEAWPASAAALEEALASGDYQQRQYAARLLRGHVDDPGDLLLAVTLEGLRDDREHGRSHPFCVNAAEGVAYLLPRAARVRERLSELVVSDDGQERFLAAVLLARSAGPQRIPETVAALVEHLRDNELPCDAILAASSLRRLGPAVLPLLADAERGADRQALDLLRLVQLDLVEPPRSHADYEARATMHDASVLQDPVVHTPDGQLALLIGFFEECGPRR